MLGLNEFLQKFGNVTLSDVITFLMILGFLYAMYKKVKTYIDNKYEEDRKKEEKEKEKDKDLQEALSAVRKYPEYREQSLRIQEKFNQEIEGLKKAQEEHKREIMSIKEATKKRERNKLYEKLSQSYKLYTDKERNPMQAWSDMESIAFWGLFDEYEAVDGDGYMHSIVKPAMQNLLVIKMDEIDKLAELMKSRKLN